MSSEITHPGVFVEELPEAGRAIPGVPTSVTGFLGTAAKGLTDWPVVIDSDGEYDRRFGGLDASSTMSYAVRNFFANGGSRAVIVRITGPGAARASVTLPGSGGDLVLEASSPGAWGNRLRVLIDHDRCDPSRDDLFNLTVEEARDETSIVDREEFRDVSIRDGHGRFLPDVLAGQSSLLRVRRSGEPTWAIGTTRPDLTLAGFVPFDGNGADGTTPGAHDYIGSASVRSGLFALDHADLFNLLCIPPPTRGGDTAPDVYAAASLYCASRRAILLVDPPAAWGANRELAVRNALAGVASGLGPSGLDARNAVVYFPRVVQADPLRDQELDVFVPCGVVAGVIARSDARRGVWMAPAGLDAALNGVRALQLNLTDAENGQLNQSGINCLREFPMNGRVVWGARTLRGADVLGDEYKYLPVRRMALFLEESLSRGTRWAVFEPNDEALWSQIRLQVGTFLHDLFRQGAFQGRTPADAYFVQCDSTTTTQDDIDDGIVNVVVGFAPLQPAEFVILTIQQRTASQS